VWEVRLSNIAKLTRTAVGPVEPFEGRTPEQMEVEYWDYLARAAREYRVVMTASELWAPRPDIEFTSKTARARRPYRKPPGWNR
jgi:hypothetical protein